MHERVKRTERQFRSLPDNQQKLLPQFPLHLDKIRKCIDHNQEILLTIVNDCVHMFENKEYGEDVCETCSVSFPVRVIVCMCRPWAGHPLYWEDVSVWWSWNSMLEIASVRCLFLKHLDNWRCFHVMFSILQYIKDLIFLKDFTSCINFPCCVLFVDIHLSL